MLSSFKALAARIGLSAERIDAVERHGVATAVQHSLDDQTHIMVRPDPDWSQRMLAAWRGSLVNSRRKVAGEITVEDGYLAIGDLDSPANSVAVSVMPGEYQLVLVVAHSGSEQTFDYEEHVSHAFLALRGRHDVATIEPYADANGVELGAAAHTMTFAIPGLLPAIAGDHAGLWALRVSGMFHPEPREDDGEERHSITITGDYGTVAAIACHAGHGRDVYPLFRLADDTGRTIGIASDFYVDNRPW